jgi:hypothetical protein
VRTRALAAVLIAILLPACGETRQPVVAGPAGNGGVAAVAGVSWTQDVWPILIVRCQFCHTSGTGADEVPDMLMTDAGTTYNAWVRVMARCNPNLFRVLPGDSGLSFVFDKVSQPAPLCGRRMPLQGATLEEAEQAAIREWIEQGALRN